MIFVIILAIFVIVLAAYVIRADTRKKKHDQTQNQEQEVWIRYRTQNWAKPKRKRRPKGQTGRKHPKKKRRKSNGID